jgi:dihydrofolate synthase / folylpolyglutamate synthase
VREFGKQFSAKRTGANVFNYRSHNLALDDVSLTMPGSHQMKNAALAVAVAEELRDRGYKISQTAIRDGIQNTVFPGRFEFLRRRPDVIIDGAHTPEGMRLLKSVFKRLYPGTKALLLLGMLQDKNYEVLLDIIAPIAREVVCVPPQGTRALDPGKLALLARRKGIPSNWAPDIAEGFEMLLNKAKEQDVVLAAGSLYMIGPVRRACGIGDDETVSKS